MIKFTEEVFLTSLDLEHKKQIRLWRNDPKIFKWCRQNDVINEASHESWFTKQGGDQTIKMWAICEENRRFIVGVCGLTSVDLINRKAEFSLYIGPEYHGYAFGRSALITMLWHGFMNYGLNSIWGETFSGNKAGKMFKDIGFIWEGARRAHYFREGRFINADLYSILFGEFEFRYLDRGRNGEVFPKKNLCGPSGKYILTDKKTLTGVFTSREAKAKSDK